MKTFNATELNKGAAKVFREADKEGSVKINHDRYPDVVFVLEARERRAGPLGRFRRALSVQTAYNMSVSASLEKGCPNPVITGKNNFKAAFSSKVEGFYEWNSTITYHTGDLVLHLGKRYRSVLPPEEFAVLHSNIGFMPSENPEYWKKEEE